MIKIIEKYPVLTLLVVVLLVMLPGLEHLQVTIMEARNFITAREMLTDGNWFLTTMNGVPRYEKPPLPTWITAFVGAFFGIKNVFALRLPGVIMVWIIGVFTFLLSNEILNNKKHSFINSLIVVTSFYVIGIVVEAPWDIYTHGFMLIGIYYLYKEYTANYKKGSVLAIFFIAFSVLSKGPISLYTLLLPFLLAYSLVYGIKNKFLLKTTISLIGGILLGGIWFAYVRIADAEAFIKTATVEASNWSSYNIKPFYYYWSFFVQSGIWTIPAFISLLYPYLKNKVSNFKAYRLSFFWTIFAVILLSVIPEKKSRYLMPVLIPLAINTGFYIQYLCSSFNRLKSKTETIPVYFNFGLMGILPLVFPYVVYFVLPDEFKQNQISILVLTPLLLLIGYGIFRGLYKKNILHIFYLTVISFALIMPLVILVNPSFSNKNENYNSISNLKDEAKKELVELYSLDTIQPEVLFYYGGIIPMLEEENGDYNLPKLNKFGILVNDEKLVTESDFEKNYIITKKESYDINIGEVNSRRHKPRYVNYYYIFQKNSLKCKNFLFSNQ